MNTVGNIWYIFVVYFTIDVSEESPSLSHKSSRDAEKVIPQDTADSFDSEICQAIKSQSVGPYRASSTPSTAWFSSRLSGLDAQLVELQRIADCLERDFSNSRMVHTHAVFCAYSAYICNDSLSFSMICTALSFYSA